MHKENSGKHAILLHRTTMADLQCVSRVCLLQLRSFVTFLSQAFCRNRQRLPSRVISFPLLLFYGILVSIRDCFVKLMPLWWEHFPLCFMLHAWVKLSERNVLARNNSLKPIHLKTLSQHRSAQINPSLKDVILYNRIESYSWKWFFFEKDSTKQMSCEQSEVTRHQF